jgi:hypothetical protein
MRMMLTSLPSLKNGKGGLLIQSKILIRLGMFIAV